MAGEWSGLSTGAGERVCVITGAGGGLGAAIARGVAQRGTAVVLVSRRPDSLQELQARIHQESPRAQVHTVQCGDISSLGEVRALGRDLSAQFPSISTLVHNAGAIFSRAERTVDGYERTFALNVLAPYLLTALLAERLAASAPARVVNVSSAAHLRQRLDWAHLADGVSYHGFRAYGRSKLALLLLTRALARTTGGRKVTVNALHPGLVRTGFGSNNANGTGRLIGWGLSLVGISPERGARTAVYLATSPEVANVTGGYFARGRPHRSSRASQNPDDASRLLAACEQMTGVPWPWSPAEA
ncbi:MAG TPA: SDR family NAD(P)-dependent oxidoreductase [Thermoplasmata archaeon]|nr:SDR family NAD(P)-dependent oxidoreductase [Thermoplasmata archaeon]